LTPIASTGHDLGVKRAVHPIEAQSYRIPRKRVDTCHLPPSTRVVAERIVYTTTEQALADGRSSLLDGYCRASRTTPRTDTAMAMGTSR
jgi:hypothetical protein